MAGWFWASFAFHLLGKADQNTDLHSEDCVMCLRVFSTNAENSSISKAPSNYQTGHVPGWGLGWAGEPRPVSHGQPCSAMMMIADWRGGNLIRSSDFSQGVGHLHWEIQNGGLWKKKLKKFLCRKSHQTSMAGCGHGLPVFSQFPVIVCGLGCEKG